MAEDLGFFSKTVVLRFSDGLALSIKAPQLVGIVCGVIVFTITIAVVIYLLFKSGSIEKFLEEMRQSPRVAMSRGKDERGPKSDTLPPQYDTRPELYEHLLEAAKTLPLQPSPPVLIGRNMQVRPLNVDEDVAHLVTASNGSPQYHESAYDPVGRIWGWLNLSPPSIFYQPPEGSAGLLPTDIDGGKDWPFLSEAHFKRFFAVSPVNGTHLVIEDTIVRKPVGMVSLVANQPAHLSVSLDNIWLTPAFQGDSRKLAHEAMLLVLEWLSIQGYRRITCEVDVRHAVMRKFLERCGFTSEAVLRKHQIIRRRNRDTALYVLLNSELVDALIALKRHLGIDPRPKMHNAASID